MWLLRTYCLCEAWYLSSYVIARSVILLFTLTVSHSIIEVLLPYGADVNAQNSSGKDAMMLASFAGHLEVVQLLRANGARYDHQDKGGSTSLHWAVDAGHLKLVKWMIRDGAAVSEWVIISMIFLLGLVPQKFTHVLCNQYDTFNVNYGKQSNLEWDNLFTNFGHFDLSEIPPR